MRNYRIFCYQPYQRMMKKLSLILITVLCIIACANRGAGPQGGPKDETPPKVVKQNPAPGTTNFAKKTITVEFDENVTLDNIADNLVVSPPQKRQPEVQAINRKLTITFDDTLQANTTYSLDFGNAIVDNNEKNVLENFVISFSTGDVIDTLAISGTILNAENLNPMAGIVAGIYPAQTFADTTLSTTVFQRIGRSDKQGHFSIQNISEGTYRLFALGDVSRDNIYQQGEGIALYDSLITPSVRQVVKPDTIWRDSTTIDSIVSRGKTQRLPDDVILMYFKEDYTRHYLQKIERQRDNAITAIFGAPTPQQPQLRLLPDTLHPERDFSNVTFYTQYNATKDTITLWLIDSVAINADTLYTEISYLKSDSLYNLQTQTDTLRSIFRRPKETKAQKRKREQEEAQQKVRYANISAAVGATKDITAPMRIKSEVPVNTYDTALIHLYNIVDTTKIAVPYTIVRDTASLALLINADWQPEQEYQLIADTAAFTDIYGLYSKEIKAKTKIKSLEEYATIIIEIQPFVPNVVLQFLNTNDEPVRTMTAEPQGTKFLHMTPGDYYLRMIIDSNADGKWTTGDITTQRHPEQVYYFPAKLTLRANWDFHELWNYNAVPLLKQKPKALIK